MPKTLSWMTSRCSPSRDPVVLTMVVMGNDGAEEALS